MSPFGFGTKGVRAGEEPDLPGAGDAVALIHPPFSFARREVEVSATPGVPAG